MKLRIDHRCSQEKFEEQFKNSQHINIVELDISYCTYIKSVPNFAVFNNLKKIDCSRNKIESIYPFENVINLDISKCYWMKQIPNFRNLQVLDCSYIQITQIPHFPNLKKLSCNSTYIKYIPFIEKLETIECSKCKYLTQIPDLPNLRILSCSSNDISHLPFLKKIKEITCYNSGIKEIFISSNSNLECVICDDNLKIKIYNKNMKIIVHNTNKNNLIKYFQGRLFQNTYRMYDLLIS